LAIRLQGLAAQEWDEPLGTEAREAMIKLVEGRTLRCEVDGERTHDRCVGICYL
jgi:endonuclease YncB( thermonuclease family)